MLLLVQQKNTFKEVAVMTYENKEYLVEIKGEKVIIIKKAFNDIYNCTLDENGNLKSHNWLSLAQGTKVRKIFGF